VCKEVIRVHECVCVLCEGVCGGGRGVQVGGGMVRGVDVAASEHAVAAGHCWPACCHAVLCCARGHSMTTALFSRVCSEVPAAGRLAD